jgi:hypothetical protein
MPVAFVADAEQDTELDDNADTETDLIIVMAILSTDEDEAKQHGFMILIIVVQVGDHLPDHCHARLGAS